jgi:hypothetical protein
MIEATGMLCVYQFAVRRENDDTYDVHMLVHLATRIWVDQCGAGAKVSQLSGSIRAVSINLPDRLPPRSSPLKIFQS